MSFQFTCPSRSTTRIPPGEITVPLVSIHVPLAEHDAGPRPFSAGKKVSIHVPLAEHDIFMM